MVGCDELMVSDDLSSLATAGEVGVAGVGTAGMGAGDV